MIGVLIEFNKIDENKIIEIDNFMKNNNIKKVITNFYISNKNSVDTILIMQKLIKSYSWFKSYILNFKLFRVEEEINLNKLF